MNCSSTLHWNLKQNKCDAPETAKCTITTNFPDSYPVCERTAVTFYPHPKKCEWFLYCYHGHMTIQQCPYFYNWDVVEQKCMERTVARCYSGNNSEIE